MSTGQGLQHPQTFSGWLAAYGEGGLPGGAPMDIREEKTVIRTCGTNKGGHMMMPAFFR